MVEKFTIKTPENYFRKLVEVEENVIDTFNSDISGRNPVYKKVKKTKQFCSIMGQECSHGTFCKDGSFSSNPQGDCRNCVFAFAYMSQNPKKIKWKETE